MSVFVTLKNDTYRYRTFLLPIKMTATAKTKGISPERNVYDYLFYQIIS